MYMRKMRTCISPFQWPIFGTLFFSPRLVERTILVRLLVPWDPQFLSSGIHFHNCQAKSSRRLCKVNTEVSGHGTLSSRLVIKIFVRLFTHGATKLAGHQGHSLWLAPSPTRICQIYRPLVSSTGHSAL